MLEEHLAKKKPLTMAVSTPSSWATSLKGAFVNSGPSPVHVRGKRGRSAPPLTLEKQDATMTTADYSVLL